MAAQTGGGRWFGRLMILPVLLLPGVLYAVAAEYSTPLWRGLDRLGGGQCAGLLLGLAGTFLGCTHRWYRRSPRLVRVLFVGAALGVDYLAARLAQAALDASRNPEDVDLLNNVDFVVVLPVVLLALLLWGWAFDAVKNRAARRLTES